MATVYLSEELKYDRRVTIEALEPGPIAERRIPGIPILALLCASACAPDVHDRVFNVRDSAGVSIAESSAPSWANADGGESTRCHCSTLDPPEAARGRICPA